MPAAHFVPQSPQLSGSNFTAVHAMLHTFSPAGQTHAPPRQACPALRQKLRHRPHDEMLCAVSAQNALQKVPLPPQSQAPFTQGKPGGHARHIETPRQLPLMQTSPAAHDFEQLPQCRGSDCRLLQSPEQSTSGAVQLAIITPPTQV